MRLKRTRTGLRTKDGRFEVIKMYDGWYRVVEFDEPGESHDRYSEAKGEWSHIQLARLAVEVLVDNDPKYSYAQMIEDRRAYYRGR